jgi:hypothetical protein
MNRDAIVARVKLLLQTNSAQLNTDLSSDDYVSFVQSAYDQLWTRISYEANSNGNSNYVDVDWPAGTPTRTLTQLGLQNAYLLGFYTVYSDDTTGPRIPGIRFQDKNTLVWDTYPQPVTTVRAYYRITAEDLVNGLSVPQLLGPEHHEAIVYEAAIQIKEALDHDIPARWAARLENLEYYAFKSISNKIFRNGSQILPADLESIVYMPQ